MGQIRAFLAQKLPPYMIPSAVVILDALPLNTSKKLDRKALPAPDATTGIAPGGYSAPTTEVERKLATLWAEALGLVRVGIHDNFFELGGHSLTAIGLFTRVEAEFGRALPLATLFRAQTVAEMAAILVGASEPYTSGTTVVIRSSASKSPPLFLVPGVRGDLLFWRELIDELGSDRPVHGLTLPEEDGVFHAYSDLRATAAHHVEQICAVQPAGPYHLAGYCIGAAVALEIAQQLVSSGRNVSLLAAINSGPSRTASGMGPFRLPRPHEFACYLSYRLADEGPWSVVREMLTRVSRRIARRNACSSVVAADTPRFSPTKEIERLDDFDKVPDQLRRVMVTNFQAWTEYVPRPYPGRVTLFRGRIKPLFHARKNDFGWGEVAQGGVEIRTVRGSHWSMLAPPLVGSVAEQVRDCLARAGDHGSGISIAEGSRADPSLAT
jgi:thioesterase domain-containing protein